MPNSFRNETLRDEIAKIVQIAHVDKLTSEATADLIVACVDRHYLPTAGADAKDVHAKAFDAAVIEFRVRWDGVMRKAVIFTFGGLALVIVAAWAWKSVN